MMILLNMSRHAKFPIKNLQEPGFKQQITSMWWGMGRGQWYRGTLTGLWGREQRATAIQSNRILFSAKKRYYRRRNDRNDRFINATASLAQRLCAPPATSFLGNFQMLENIADAKKSRYKASYYTWKPLFSPGNRWHVRYITEQPSINYFWQ